MRFAHYLGRACIYGEEGEGEGDMGKGNGNGKDIRGSRNQCASRITWDAPVFTDRRRKGRVRRLGVVVTYALRAFTGTRLHLRREE